MDTSGDQRLDFEEFKQSLKQLDRKLKSLPATAQVASQQGEYLARLLNKTNGEVIAGTTEALEQRKIAPFKYRHMGSFAYVGDNKAVLQLPLLGLLALYLSSIQPPFQRDNKQMGGEEKEGKDRD